MASFGRLSVAVGADTRPFEKAVAASAKKAGGDAGKSMSGTFKGVLAGGAVLEAGKQIFNFGKDSVKAFEGAEKNSIKFNASMKLLPDASAATTKALTNQASSLSKVTTYSAGQTKQAQAQLAMYHLTGKQIQQMTPLVLDYAARTGQDAVSAAGGLGKALLGQGRALKAVGINFKNTGSTAGNFNEIMTTLGPKVSGVATQMGETSAGKMAILGNQFTAIKVKIGAQLVPALSQLLSTIMPVMNFIMSNVAWLKYLAIAIGVVAVGFKAWTIATSLWSGVTKAAAVAQAALNAVMAANPIFLVIAAIVALVAVFVILWLKCAWFRNFWIGLWNSIVAIAISVWNAIRTAALVVWGAIQTAISAVWNAIKTAISVSIHAIQTTISTVWNVIRMVFATALSAIWTAITFYFNVYKTIILTVFNVYKTIIFTAWNVIKTIFAAALNWIKATVSAAFNAVKATIQTVWNGIKVIIQTEWNGISAIFGWMKAGVRAVGTAFSAVKDAIGAAWGQLQNIAKKPVTFIVNSVINPLIKGVNFLITKIGIKAIPEIKLGFAEGGKVPGGYGGGDRIPAMLEPGEWVLTKTQARAIGYAQLRGLPHYQEGGYVGGGTGITQFGLIPGWVKSAAGAIGGAGKALWNIGADAVDAAGKWIRAAAAAAFEALAKPLKGLLGPYSKDPAPVIPSQWLANTMIKAIDKSIDFVKGKSKSDADLGLGLSAGVPNVSGTGMTAIWDALRAVGFGEIQAAGIMGNMQSESGFNPFIVQGGGVSMNPAAAGGGGYGLVQWTPGAKLIPLLHGRAPSIATEVAALAEQLRGSEAGAGRMLAAATSPAGAARAFGLGYERYAGGPQTAREQQAEAIYRIFAGKGKLRAVGGARFDSGGMLPVGMSVAVNTSGRPEPVLTGAQWDALTGGSGDQVTLLRSIARLLAGGTAVQIDGRPVAAAVAAATLEGVST